jgi:glycosyltransferase involved in cell wall biosynthesis
MPERFHWLTLPSQAMPALYRSADALLHMSRDEPFGNIYPEALATGLPIVTTDRPATRWALEDCGQFVDTTDLPTTAAALDRAIHAPDSQRIQKRRALVRRRYAWPVIADRYAAFFDAVCNADPATPPAPMPKEVAA